MAVVMDRALRDYAEQAGITSNTARWPLKQVPQKNGYRRQSELVRLVLASVAVVVG